MSDLKTGVQAQEPAAENNSPRPQLQFLDVDRLQVFPQARGVAFEDLDVADLVDSVRAHGVEQPLIVCPIDKDPEGFAVICGHRRLKAAIETGAATVPVLIREDLQFGQSESAEPIQRLQIEENLHRQQLTPLQEAQAIKGYMKTHNLSVSATAKNLALSRPFVQDAIKIAELEKLASGGARRLAPPDSKGKDPKDIFAGLSKSHLLLLANNRKESCFDQLLARCQRGDSVRALRRFLEATGKAAKKKSKPLQTVRVYSATLFNGQARIAATLEAEDAFLASEAAVDAEIRQEAQTATQDMMDALIQAVVALPAESAATAGETQSPNPTGETGRDPAVVEPTDNPPKGLRPAPEGWETMSTEHLVALAAPPVEATHAYWHQIKDSFQDTIAPVAFKAEMEDMAVLGEFANLILLGMRDHRHVSWYNANIRAKIGAKTRGRRPFFPIDTRRLNHA